MAESKVALKLLIDTKGKKVLFAEAGKDFVDFIFHILSLPVATVVRLLGRKGMVGCLGNLYDSVENLNDCYIQLGQNKDVLLKPNAPNPFASVPLLLQNDVSTSKAFYRCGSFCGYRVTDDPRAICPSCRQKMATVMPYVAPPPIAEGLNEGGGFVKGVVTYMIMDNLTVKPVSTISTITLLNKFNVKAVGELQEKEVTVGMNEALKLLKASLLSNNVLTTVFLNDV